MTNSQIQLRKLWRLRSRSWFVRVNLVAVVVLWCIAWVQLSGDWSEFFSNRRVENLQRFAKESYPYSIRNQPFSFLAFVTWIRSQWTSVGFEAILSTFAISMVAISLAGISAFFLVFAASRNVAVPNPFLPGKNSAWHRRLWWKTIVGLARTLFVLSRVIPEYVWAFLLIAILGPNAWPAILALAIHNFGILGKLGAEIVENSDPTVPMALRAKGLSRAQICTVALVPMSLSKWMLFFFYRWETCIREATVLGMLGISSIGFWVRESRARDKYDEMLFFMLLGATLVLIVDMISAVTRWMVRRG